MKCLICSLRIRENDSILLVTEAVYNGPREGDITHRIGASRIDGTIHLKCMKNSGDVARTPNTAIVERSDALTVFEGD